MAITQDYVSATGTEGNDYKGATFTDGAYTKATKTLTKAGAFAASKVNHYIYITGTHITSGYYKISDVTGAPNAVILATEASSDGNDSTDVHCTQAAGTALLPWRSLQGAFDLCTRNATDGNQVNLKAGTAQVNAAALDLTTFVAGGALAAAGPLIVRGYTAAANDGGIGEIDCGGFTMFTATTYDYVILVDLEIHTFGDNHGVQLDTYCTIFRCEVHKGASAPDGKRLINIAAGCTVLGCYLHDPGTGAAYGIYTSGSPIINCYVNMGAAATGIGIYKGGGSGSDCLGNVVVCGAAGQTGISFGDAGVCSNNVAYNSTAGTGRGINIGTVGRGITCANNVVEGWSGVGGIGIAGSNPMWIGYNAYYNNTANYTAGDMTFIDLTANDVALAASPFVDKANGDFSLTAAGKTALRGVGWPAAYLGAHANTDGHITIGPIQYGEAEAGGGGMLVGNKRANKEG